MPCLARSRDGSLGQAVGKPETGKPRKTGKARIGNTATTDTQVARRTSRINPFSPTFGASPPLLAGRDPIIEDFDEALEAGPGHPDYTILVTAARPDASIVYRIEP